jgi:MFS family permease
MSEPSSTFRQSASVLRSGLFARFMVAEFISMVGSWMQTQAQQFEVEKQATTSVEQALISAAMMAVIPLLSPLGGTLADRWDKRRILFVAIFIQALLAATAGWLVHVGALQLWHLGIMAFLVGVTAAFEMPAYSALLPELVPREKMAAAVAMDRSVFHAARIIGPALAGMMIAGFGRAIAFFANAVSYIGPLIVLCTIPKRPRGTEAEEKKRGGGFSLGWNFVKSDAPTKRMVLIMAANSFFCSPFVIILLTWYGERTLHLKEWEMGWLMSLSGIGALSASMILLAITAARRFAVLRFGAAISVLSMFGLASASGFWFAALAICSLTFGLNFIFGIANQVIQERAPDEIRGRVSSVAAMSFVAVIPFSGIITAMLETWAGMRAALIVCACAYAIVAGLILRSPEHR